MHNKFINSVIQQIPSFIDKLKDNEIKLDREINSNNSYNENDFENNGCTQS